MSKRYNLFLDDYRTPISAFEYTKFIPFIREEWVIVRDFNEFCKVITEHGLPELIAFDHDLAQQHYVPEFYWDDYDASKKYQEEQVYTEKTGLDCAKWLVEYCIDNKFTLPEWYVHSMNPVGADNINAYLNNFKKQSEDFVGM